MIMLTSKSDSIPFYQPVGNEIALFEYAYNNQLPLLIKGPTGCGKTRFIRRMASRLGRPLFTVVEARKDTTVVLHPLADDRRILPIDRTGELLMAPAQFMLVISYNPGYQNFLKGMKPSTRQRFISLRFQFPQPEVERIILIQESGIEPSIAAQLVTLAGALRALKDHDLEESVSTRLLIYAAKLIKDGFPPVESCRSAMVETLTDDLETAHGLMEVVHAIFGE
ncbi:MAG: cbbQ [Magnetococcales bacterium]|nr:cbbQ [Magnetococcales bacterium]